MANVMDEGTRFQLALVISRERRVEDVRRVFQTAKKNAKRISKYIINRWATSVQESDKKGVQHKDKGNNSHQKYRIQRQDK